MPLTRHQLETKTEEEINTSESEHFLESVKQKPGNEKRGRKRKMPVHDSGDEDTLTSEEKRGKKSININHNSFSIMHGSVGIADSITSTTIVETRGEGSSSRDNAKTDKTTSNEVIVKHTEGSHKLVDILCPFFNVPKSHSMEDTKGLLARAGDFISTTTHLDKLTKELKASNDKLNLITEENWDTEYKNMFKTMILLQDCELPECDVLMYLKQLQNHKSKLPNELATFVKSERYEVVKNINHTQNQNEHTDAIDNEEEIHQIESENTYELDHSADEAESFVPQPIECALELNSDGIISNLTAGNYVYYKDYISRAREEKKKLYDDENKIRLGDMMFTEAFTFDGCDPNSTFRSFYPVKNYEERCTQLDEEIETLNRKQREAFNSITSTLMGKNNQLFMFLSGEGGTGKSKVIHCVVEFCRLYFGKQEGEYGSVVAMAPTGSAATNIDGHTWHSVLNKGRTNENPNKINIKDDTARKIGQKLKGVKLCIIDEVSLCSLEQLYEINYRLQNSILATIPLSEVEDREKVLETPFGGMHVLLCGDFFQLKCVSGTAIYEQHPNSKFVAAVKGRELWNKLTSFLELKENMRITRTNDESSKQFATFIHNIRIGSVDELYLQNVINKKVCSGSAAALQRAHPDAIWIANTRSEVDEYNAVQFQHLHSTGVYSLRIVAQHKPYNPNLIPYPSLEEDEHLFRQCHKKKTDLTPTYIDLAIGSTVILTRNLETSLGLVNGAKGRVIAFGFLENNIVPKTMEERFPKQCEFHLLSQARTLPIVFVQFNNLKYEKSAIRNIQHVIPIVAEPTDTFRINNKKYTRYQIPIRPAAAITAHKAQSMTAIHGAVVAPTPPGVRVFARSLEYVSLSRSTDINKLILLNPIAKRHFTSHINERRAIINEYIRLYDNLSN